MPIRATFMSVNFSEDGSSAEFGHNFIVGDPQVPKREGFLVSAIEVLPDVDNRLWLSLTLMGE